MTPVTDLRERVLEPRVPPSGVEWRSVASGRHNLLLEGPKVWTAAVLRRLEPLLDAPVIWASSHRLCTLPSSDRGALILQDVAALSGDDQQRLLEWLNERRQLISTTAQTLFPLVVAGGFDEVLYYRLNVIRLHWPADDLEP